MFNIYISGFISDYLDHLYLFIYYSAKPDLTTNHRLIHPPFLIPPSPSPSPTLHSFPDTDTPSPFAPTTTADVHRPYCYSLCAVLLLLLLLLHGPGEPDFCPSLSPPTSHQTRPSPPPHFIIDSNRHIHNHEYYEHYEHYEHYVFSSLLDILSFSRSISAPL